MSGFAAGAPAPGRRGAPALLVIAAVAVAVAAVLPLVYLAIRVAEGGTAAWALVDPAITAQLVLDTALLVAGVVVAGLAVAVPLAWLVVRTDLPLRRVIGVAAVLPLVIPSYVAALVLLGALGPRGLAQGLLEGPFGVERMPELYGYPGALLALTLSTYPYIFLLVAAGLRTVDPGLEEAARGLGRSRLGVFWSVTVPSVRPALVAGSLLVALYVLADFGAVSLMQYPTLTRAIFLHYETLFDRTSAAALALVLVAMTAAILALEARWRGGRGRTSRSGPGSARRARPLTLGTWRWPAFAYCATLVTLFLLLPVGVLCHWALEAVRLGLPLGLAWEAMVGSLAVSGAAAGAAALAVLPVALFARRYPSRRSRFVERTCFTSNALPGIVVALSLVFFAARYAPFVYQTLALLVFAYVVRFLPQALASSGAALESVSPRVEESARALGRGPLRVLFTVTLRLARPGILAGAALVFLSAMKELPATLLLRPIGFETLATEIWKQTSIGAYAQAAPAALLLIVASAPLLWAFALRPEGGRAGPGG